MLPGLFYRKLKKCNKDLKIYASRTLDTPSGLYVEKYGERKHICGVDNKDIPERHFSDQIGHVIKRGWRVTLQILINKHLIRQLDAEKIFDTKFGPGTEKKSTVVGEIKKDLIKEIEKESALEKSLVGGKEEAVILKSDMVMDFAKEIDKEQPIKDKSVEQIYAEQQKGITEDRA